MYDYSALTAELLYEDDTTVTLLGKCPCGRIMVVSSQHGRDRAESNLRVAYRNHTQRGSDRLCPHGAGRS